MNGTPYGNQGAPYTQNSSSGVPPGQMNQNGFFNQGNAPGQAKPAGQAKSFAGSCCAGCVAMVAAL